MTPGSVTLAFDATQQFTAQGTDQFGNAMVSDPTFYWSTTAGLLTSSYSYVTLTAQQSGTITASSAPGNGISGTAGVTVVLPRPAAPSFTATAVSATQINLSWDAVSVATGYLVNEWTGSAWQQIGSFGSSTTSDALTGLTPGTGYTLSVGACNSSGTSWANYQGVTTFPAAPSFTATAVSATQINLSWNAVSGATGYLVNEWTGIAWQQIGSFGSGTTSDALTGLTPGTGYTLSVGAYNSSGTSWANYQGVTTPNDWFGEHMSDPTLRALARNDFERDGGITRGDMIGLLYQAASGAAVSAADIQDLQAMVAAAGTLNVPGYVAELASKVVNGNPANWILGGAFRQLREPLCRGSGFDAG